MRDGGFDEHGHWPDRRRMSAIGQLLATKLALPWCLVDVVRRDHYARLCCAKEWAAQTEQWLYDELCCIWPFDLRMLARMLAEL